MFNDAALSAARADISNSFAAKQSDTILGWTFGDGLSLTRAGNPFDYDMTLGTLYVFRDWLEVIVIRIEHFLFAGWIHGQVAIQNDGLLRSNRIACRLRPSASVNLRSYT